MSSLPKSGKRLIKKSSESRSSDENTKVVQEADTTSIVNDLLLYVLGNEEYLKITREFPARGTYTDLDTDSQIRFLMEVKAFGQNLKGNHHH